MSSFSFNITLFLYFCKWFPAETFKKVEMILYFTEGVNISFRFFVNHPFTSAEATEEHCRPSEALPDSRRKPVPWNFPKKAEERTVPYPVQSVQPVPHLKASARKAPLLSGLSVPASSERVPEQKPV